MNTKADQLLAKRAAEIAVLREHLGELTALQEYGIGVNND
jgi:hypothetical protein